jgi:hypothetical protein
VGWRGRRREREREAAWHSESSTDETTVQQQIRCEFRKLSRWFLIGTALLSVLILGVGTAADYRSCLRSRATRAELTKASRYWRSHGRPDLAVRFKPPKTACFHLPPGT